MPDTDIHKLAAEIQALITAPVTIDEEIGVIGWQYDTGPRPTCTGPVYDYQTHIRRLSPEERIKAVELRKAGWTIPELVKHFGMRSPSAMRKILGPELCKKQKKETKP